MTERRIVLVVNSGGQDVAVVVRNKEGHPLLYALKEMKEDEIAALLNDAHTIRG